MGLIPDYRQVQQDLTELNSDGNRERGHYGEDLSKETPEEPEPEEDE